MTRYTPDSRDRVRDAVDMVKLVEARVDLRRAGVDSYFGCCPFHDERTASFHIRPDEKHYHCFGCSESGDPFDFVMQTEGLDFVGALESLADRFGVTLETVDENPEAELRRKRRERLYSLLTRTSTFYERMFWESREGRPARDYMLKERGLSEEVLRTFRVGWAPDSWDRVLIGSRGAGFSDEEMLGAGLIQRSRKDTSRLYDRFRRQIMFPTADSRGRVIGFGGRKMPDDDREWLGKYINTAEGEVYSKRAVLYGISEARGPAAKAGRMVLAEGYTDVIALHQAGVSNAVGIMGTSLTREQVAELVRLVKVLELCLDADNAGEAAMARAAQLCAETGLELRVVALPRGADPGEMIKSAGAPALRQQVATSAPFVVFEVERLLGQADLGSSEGKDRAIATLAPALARVPESLLLDDLRQRIATALAIPESRLATLLKAAGSGGGLSGPPPSGGAWADDDPGPFDPGYDIDPGPEFDPGPPQFADRAAVAAAPLWMEAAGRAERDYLAMCLSAGTAGLEDLRSVDLARLIASPVLRQAAFWIIGDMGQTVVGADEREVSSAIDSLETVARTFAGIGVGQLRHAHLLLDFRRVDGEIRSARASGAGFSIALAKEKQRLQMEMGEVAARFERPL